MSFIIKSNGNNKNSIILNSFNFPCEKQICEEHKKDTINIQCFTV